MNNLIVSDDEYVLILAALGTISELMKEKGDYDSANDYGKLCIKLSRYKGNKPN